jgi:hypothetical protein
MLQGPNELHVAIEMANRRVPVSHAREKYRSYGCRTAPTKMRRDSMHSMPLTHRIWSSNGNLSIRLRPRHTRQDESWAFLRTRSTVALDNLWARGESQLFSSLMRAGLPTAVLGKSLHYSYLLAVCDQRRDFLVEADDCASTSPRNSPVQRSSI